MKKYVVYEWSRDIISGYGIAIKGTKAHYPIVPFSTKTLIGEFDTIDELIDILLDYEPDYDKESIREEIINILFKQVLDLEANI